MAGDGETRRLAAIMASDVVGYTALMGTDEAGTLSALRTLRKDLWEPDRKSTRLNSSHVVTSYAVFCLKKKK